MRETNTNRLFKNLQKGKVYRRSELLEWGNIDRHLKKLTENKSLRKVGPGLYYKPKKTPYGELPPEEKDLIRSFLKSNDFLLVNEGWYTSLGLGFTQLYAHSKVFNKQRHGVIKLGNQTYHFQREYDFPKKLTKEFLLVDLMNNTRVTDTGNPIEEHVESSLKNFDKENLLQAALKYGKIKTKKFFQKVLL